VAKYNNVIKANIIFLCLNSNLVKILFRLAVLYERLNAFDKTKFFLFK